MDAACGVTVGGRGTGERRASPAAVPVGLVRGGGEPGALARGVVEGWVAGPGQVHCSEGVTPGTGLPISASGTKKFTWPIAIVKVASAFGS